MSAVVPNTQSQLELKRATPNLLSAKEARAQAHRYLTELIAGCTPNERIGVFSIPDNAFRTFAPNEIDTAISHMLIKQDVLLRKSKLLGVYFQQGMSPVVPERGRWSSDDISSVGVFFSDLDYGTVGHTKNLPPDLETILEIASTFALKPSFIIGSGGGIYPIYLLTERVDGKTFTQTNQRYINALTRVLVSRGYAKADATIDATRILRAPGTLNGKDGMLRQCQILSETLDENGEVKRYTLAEFIAAIEALEAAYPAIERPRPASTGASNIVQFPAVTMDDQVIIELLTSDDRFALLYACDLSYIESAYGGDWSGVDGALTMKLAYYTRDFAQIERIWLNSPLGQRIGAPTDKQDKTVKRADYRKLTIDSALAKQNGQYNPTTEKPAPGSVAAAVTEAEQAEENERKKPVMRAEAYYGLAGDAIRLADPYTEAGHPAMLADFLTRCGAAMFNPGCGPKDYDGPHVMIAATRHCPRLYTAVVGHTSAGRKGESAAMMSKLFEVAEDRAHVAWKDMLENAGRGDEWRLVRMREIKGLGSGEGLINALRDPIEFKKPAAKAKKDEKNQAAENETMMDAGVEDKRVIIKESELASLFAVMSRQGNTISQIVRDAWDEIPTLESTTKNSPMRATGVHVSIIGHITPHELRVTMSETQSANGFGNRFLWIYTERSKFLPLPEVFDARTPGVAEFADRLFTALGDAQHVGVVDFDAETEAWYVNELYKKLSTPHTVGVCGELSARAAPMVRRLAMIYALLDGCNVVKMPHLKAALAVWDYSMETVVYLWGDAVGDEVADTILRGLRSRGPMTSTQISNDLFARNIKSERLMQALNLLIDSHKVVEEKPDTKEAKGRPAKVYRAL